MLNNKLKHGLIYFILLLNSAITTVFIIAFM